MAIIAVLVAIAIPIFTNQLEKSREATDLANARDYYSQVSVALLDGTLTAVDDSMTLANGITAKLTTATAATNSSDGTYVVEVSGMPVTQAVSGWVTTPLIANVTATGDVYNHGTNKTCKVTFTFKEKWANNSTSSYLDTVVFSQGS